MTSAEQPRAHTALPFRSLQLPPVKPKGAGSSLFSLDDAELACTSPQACPRRTHAARSWRYPPPAPLPPGLRLTAVFQLSRVSHSPLLLSLHTLPPALTWPTPLTIPRFTRVASAHDLKNTRATSSSLAGLTDFRNRPARPAPKQKKLPTAPKPKPADEQPAEAAGEQPSEHTLEASNQNPDLVSVLNTKLKTRSKDQAAAANASKTSSEETEWWQEPRLETGEQAISFFARNGSSKSAKFVYLNRVKVMQHEFRPYDLVVTSRDHAEHEYFTMSAKGVTHAKPKTPSEFIPLSEWMRQSTIYNVLTSINYFKHYISIKLFKTW